VTSIPAIVVPYRDREQQLDVLLAHLPRYLRDHHLERFQVVVSEQLDASPFSPALSRNVGALFALRTLPECNYIVFNDVDILPFRNVDYGKPRETAAWFMNAGSCKVLPDVLLQVNGYNNQFSGWGYEDSEFWWRLAVLGFPSYAWHRSEEAREAEVVNLECCGMSAAELDAETVRYFGSLEGPRFVAGNGLLEGVRRVDKRGFFEASIRESNLRLLEGARQLPHESARRYIAAYGISQIALSQVSSERADDHTWRLGFDSRKVLRDGDRHGSAVG
jgi:hypothetical protein